MARHDLIELLGLESLKSELQKKPHPAWGRVEAGADPAPLKFARELSESVLQVFLQQDSFLKCDPVLLGSWARGELAPGSDLDLLFLGPEDEVKKLVGWAQQKGLKIRSRIPEDFDDLAVGVELWDQMSLLDGRALTPRAEEILWREQRKLLLASSAQKKKWLKTLQQERSQRHSRFDSMQNLLEPNLKMGLGGLRDLQQAKLIQKLFPDLGEMEKHASPLFDFYLSCFLWIRLLLHLEGQGDLIASHLQPNLAESLGFQDYHSFMSFVQRGLSRVSFYSDWILEEAAQSPSKRKEAAKKILKKPQDLTKALLQDPSVLTQYQVRRSLDVAWPEKKLEKERKARGRELRKFFGAKVQEKHWIALFRSRLMDRLLPELKPLVGYVQHDQYHRYSADAHILQVIRQVLRARKSSRHLGALTKIAKNLKPKDWDLLLWTAIYHDLAKGRPEEHSDLGAKWVKRDLKAFGLSASDTKEVEWLVQNHLAFSTAALRRDPEDSRVLTELNDLDLTPGRIQRLLVFTAIDILGTNHQAWNEWKAKLLAQLGEKLLRPERKQQVQLLKTIESFSHEDRSRLLAIAKEVGLQALKKDLEKTKHKTSEPFEFFLVKKRIWIRYHVKEDAKGILANVLGLFFQSGVSVLQASVMTLPGIGIYDWFCLDFSGSLESLKKRLKLLIDQNPGQPPHVKWERVELTQTEARTWTLLFRGMDQRGLLWSAAAALSEAGIEIKSAQVQTWGEKAEDLFVIQAPAESAEIWLEKFRRRLQGSEK